MVFWSIFAFFYGCVAVFAMAQTVSEHRRNNHRWSLYSLGGMLLCLVWPLLILGTFIALKFAEREVDHQVPAKQGG